MLLQPFQLSDIDNLSTWFSNQAQLTEWAGPDFLYPFTRDALLTELQPDRFYSYSLKSEQGELLAFGQYYPRLGRCNLGRLVVNPQCRGQGIAGQLLAQLIQQGLTELGCQQASLFVYANNQKAIRAYQKFGFELCQYPGDDGIDGCLYMVK